mmetsp:Transcript_56856/g.166465  ORF Transcript_56856/g.166465 Transcript_56856/m.166465 type:complete len:241 (-) Transcript_56856:97-819(-)
MPEALLDLPHLPCHVLRCIRERPLERGPSASHPVLRCIATSCEGCPRSVIHLRRVVHLHLLHALAVLAALRTGNGAAGAVALEDGLLRRRGASSHWRRVVCLLRLVRSHHEAPRAAQGAGPRECLLLLIRSHRQAPRGTVSPREQRVGRQQQHGRGRPHRIAPQQRCARLAGAGEASCLCAEAHAGGLGKLGRGFGAKLLPERPAQSTCQARGLRAKLRAGGAPRGGAGAQAREDWLPEA